MSGPFSKYESISTNQCKILRPLPARHYYIANNLVRSPPNTLMKKLESDRNLVLNGE